MGHPVPRWNELAARIGHPVPRWNGPALRCRRPALPPDREIAVHLLFEAVHLYFVPTPNAAILARIHQNRPFFDEITCPMYVSSRATTHDVPPG
jgi:hypothetical protein